MIDMQPKIRRSMFDCMEVLEDRRVFSEVDQLNQVNGVILVALFAFLLLLLIKQ